ncbi:vWA domain-containing protein [Bizionia myxarmorum]|uniref:VWA domain-containing protein n=1 Tax=Bizionia myxarmorum TaxID=291186 RepID=A0A5D0QXW1_9FLAO|nr:vWA domain-containing protein [Bizionia myxarmorum]TYB74047.1 VWA domain-containing protein [Bizionia myxarmorum]
MSNKLQKKQAPSIVVKPTIDLTKINTGALTAGLSKLTIPRLFYQLVIFVMDGSGSMTYEGKTGKSKGDELSDSLIDTLKRLKASKNKNCFDVSMYAYANESICVLRQVPIKDLDLTKNYNPCDFITHYNSTKLGETMEAVKQECNDYLKINGEKNAQALIIVLSDGVVFDYDLSLKKCNELKLNNKITIASIFFESVSWQEGFNIDDLESYKKYMQDMASNESLFTSTLNADEIRNHMIKSISTVSKIN